MGGQVTDRRCGGYIPVTDTLMAVVISDSIGATDAGGSLIDEVVILSEAKNLVISITRPSLRLSVTEKTALH